MSRHGTAYTDHSLQPGSFSDRIERQIIRAYVQLVFKAKDTTGSRAALVARFGPLEVRLTELPQENLPQDMPPFWLEVYSPATGASIDGCGCFEFDEVELAAAVELVLEAMRLHRLYH